MAHNAKYGATGRLKTRARRRPVQRLDGPGPSRQLCWNRWTHRGG